GSTTTESNSGSSGGSGSSSSATVNDTGTSTRSALAALDDTHNTASYSPAVSSAEPSVTVTSTDPPGSVDPLAGSTSIQRMSTGASQPISGLTVTDAVSVSPSNSA